MGTRIVRDLKAGWLAKEEEEEQMTTTYRPCGVCVGGKMFAVNLTRRCGTKTSYGAHWRCAKCGRETWTPISKRERQQIKRRGIRNEGE